jgi:hypothetical protein
MVFSQIRHVNRITQAATLNGVIFALCLALLALGQWSDARVHRLAPLSEKDLALVGIVSIAWVGAVRWIWRARLMERLFGLERSEAPATA